MNCELRRTQKQKMVWEKEVKEKFVEVSKPNTERGNKMKRYIILALGLLVLLPGLVFAQKKGSTKVIQKNSPGVQTSVIQTTLKGEVVASDTLNLPDTVYAGMPFTGSMKVAEATKVGWVEVEGKKYPTKTGLLQVAGVFASAGALIVSFLDEDGKKIGTSNVTVIKPPDSHLTNYPEIVQTGTNANIWDKGIDGMGGNTLAQIGKAGTLPIVTEIPGRTIVKIPNDLKAGKQPFHFKEDGIDIARSVTVTRAHIIGPEQMRKNQVANFELQLTGLEEWNFEEKPLSVDIRSEGSVKAGETGEIFHTIEGVNQSGVCVIPFQGTATRSGSFDITAMVISVFGDPWDKLKKDIKTDEDFKRWAERVQDYLKKYAAQQGTDDIGKAAKSSAEKASENLEALKHSSADLEAKIRDADIYLRPVTVPKAGAFMFGKGFDFYQKAIKAVTTGDWDDFWDALGGAIDFLKAMGKELDDDELKKKAEAAKKAHEALEKAKKAKEAAEKIEELQEKAKEAFEEASKEYEGIGNK